MTRRHQSACASNLQVHNKPDVASHYAVLNCLTTCEQSGPGDDYPHASGAYTTGWYYYVFVKSSAAGDVKTCA